MKRYNIMRNGSLLGVVDVDETQHQPVYKVTNIDGKTSCEVNTFKNRNAMRSYLDWAYPGSMIVTA